MSPSWLSPTCLSPRRFVVQVTGDPRKSHSFYNDNNRCLKSGGAGVLSPTSVFSSPPQCVAPPHQSSAPSPHALLCQLTVENSIKSATKCTIPRAKIQKNFWGGATAPCPDLTPTGEGVSPPQTLPPLGLRPLDRPSPTQPPSSC